MQSLGNLIVKRCRNSVLRRHLCCVPFGAFPDELQNQVLVEGKACSRVAILNRPSALNALNTDMCARLHKLYTSWEDDPDIGFVVIKGLDRAFCAGGDIVALYHLLNEGKTEEVKEFFQKIYKFIYLVGTYLKPHVAILNGITMGGGAGVSIPGGFRLATGRTVFATPETQIGFHPDAGASYYLSHLPGHLGEYLGLTGEKFSGVEMLACGLATHYSLPERVHLIEEQLGKLITNDPSDIEAYLEKFSDPVYPDESSVLHRMEKLDKCFSCSTVEEIMDALYCDFLRNLIKEEVLKATVCQESEMSTTDNAWCSSALLKLKEASPLSLKVSLRSIREGRNQTFDQCLAREYRMSIQGISKLISNDFCEGVRARMVDKDFTPKWDPPSLASVSEDMVEQYFHRLSEAEPDLDLPTETREAFK